MKRHQMEEFLHDFDMKMNKASNEVIMKYVPKGNQYCSTLSFKNRVIIAVEVHSVGSEHFWCELCE